MWAVVAALLLLPFVWPADQALARTLSTGLALGVSLRLAALRAGLVHPSMRRRPALLLLWLVVPTATHVPATQAERQAVRRLGALRLARALVKAVFLLAIVLGKPQLASSHVAHTLALAFQVYFMIAGLADVFTGVLGVCGVAADDAFFAPFAATSPAEFWGRRWNVFVNQFLSRHLFRPWARRGRALVGVLAAFVASGIGHEYFAVAVVGWRAYRPGLMFAFFFLHGLAVIAQGLWSARRGRSRRRLPRPLAWALHMAWITVTVPLFVLPVMPIVEVFDATLRAWWALLAAQLS